MREAVIVSTARTPIGRAFRGAFNNTHGATMAGHAIEHAVRRAGLEPAEVEDVILGCGLPEGATGTNIARLAAVRAGLAITTAAVHRSKISDFQFIGSDRFACLIQDLGLRRDRRKNGRDDNMGFGYIPDAAHDAALAIR
jgi:hypothetical protein